MEEQFHAQFYRAEPKISIADLFKLKQRPNEPAESFLKWFKGLKNRCPLQVGESQMADLALGGLNLEFRKKFDGHVFRDICELGTRVTKFESLMKKKNQRKNSSIGTYYTDSNHCVSLDVNPTLLGRLLK